MDDLRNSLSLYIFYEILKKFQSAFFLCKEQESSIESLNPEIVNENIKKNIAAIIREAEEIVYLHDLPVEKLEGSVNNIEILLNSMFSDKDNTLYFIPQVINQGMNYPVSKNVKTTYDLKNLWKNFEKDLEKIIPLPDGEKLLILMEKYFSYVPTIKDKAAVIENISLFQSAKLTVAIANNIYNYVSASYSTDIEQKSIESEICNRDDKRHLLVGGDLSGVQNFIYTISSTGALKSLRGRSFYLEMITEKVVHDIIRNFHLTYANVIYSGGGGFYLIAPNSEKNK